jgi:hypothetical protein
MSLRLAALLSLALAIGLNGLVRAQEAPSLLAIPVELDLTPVFSAADALVPRQAGHPHWDDWHGFKVRYQAWRGPLAITMQGDVMLVQAHVRYRAEGRKDLLGSLAVHTGCGIDEPPRQALIGVAIRLSLAPDWSLRPAFQTLPTHFIDRCEITALAIDVSPLVERAFQTRLRDALIEALDAARPSLNALRVGAERGWQALQTPRALGPGLWLAARPVGLAMAPPIGRGRTLSTLIGIWLHPLITSAEPQPLAARGLPPLMPLTPGAPGLVFDLRMEVSLTDLAAAVRRQLTGQAMTAGGYRLILSEIAVSAVDGQVALDAHIAGDTTGVLRVRARPAFDPASGEIGFEDLDLSFDTPDPETQVMLALFDSQIREHLRGMANAALTQRLEAALMGIEGELTQWLGHSGRLDASGLALTALEIRVGDDRIALQGRAEGVVRVVLGTSGDD